MLSFYLSMVETEEERNLITELYTKYEQKMYRVAMSILHNNHSAEDAVHEAFLRIINKLSELTFDNDKKTEALVVIIVKRISLNMLKKEKHTEINEILDETAEDEAAALAFRQIEENSAVEVINMLPDELREIIALRYIFKSDVSTIANAMGLSTAAVYARIRKAKEIMRTLLEEKYGIKRF